MARCQIETERVEKVLMREQSITRLDSTSSSIVTIPKEMKERLKTAKSYREFTEGKLALKKYYEDTMDQRIETKRVLRNEAINVSINKDMYPISITPMKGTQYFNEGSGSVLSLDISSVKSHKVKDNRPLTSPSLSTNLRSSYVKKSPSSKYRDAGNDKINRKTGVNKLSFSPESDIDIDIGIDDSLCDQDQIVNEYMDSLISGEEFTASCQDGKSYDT